MAIRRCLCSQISRCKSVLLVVHRGSFFDEFINATAAVIQEIGNAHHTVHHTVHRPAPPEIAHGPIRV